MEPSFTMTLEEISERLNFIGQNYGIEDEKDLQALATAINILGVWDKDSTLMYFFTNGGNANE